MEIEKIRNYNQRILAVFGSLAVLLMLLAIVVVLVNFIDDLRWRHKETDNEMVSNEVAEKNYEKQIRTHQVSFENLQLIDSSNYIYLLPVSQSALKLEEFLDKNKIESEESLGVLDMYGGYSNFYYGPKSFNNALVFNSRDGSVRKLFRKRLSINKISIQKIKDKPYVFFAVTDKDSNKDGVLGANDLKTLYYYSVSDMDLTAIENEGADYADFDIIPGTSQLIIKYGLDNDSSGKFDWDEPMVLKTYEIGERALKDLISPGLIDGLQATLDGKL